MKSIYYDCTQLLSHKAIFNFVIGNRGGGKTFDAKKKCITRFKKKGQQFVWVRRYQTEIDTLSEFWADIAKFYPNDTLTCEGNKLYINGELAGYLIALTKAMQLKSVAFPNVSLIVFDEFLLDKGRITYLKNEVEVFMELFETIARTRDNVVALFLGNAISSVNPYFEYFKITPKIGQKFTKGNGVCIEFYFNEDFIKMKQETRFGKVIKDTSYGEYNMLNKFLRDSDSYLCKRPPTADYKLYQFILDGFKFSLWKDIKMQNFYVDRSFEHNFGQFRTYVLNPNDMDVNDESHILLKRTSQITKYLHKLVEYGDIYFCDQSTKQRFFDFLLTFK